MRELAAAQLALERRGPDTSARPSHRGCCPKRRESAGPTEVCSSMSLVSDDPDDWEDFTNASPWEHLQASLEQVLRDWGLQNKGAVHSIASARVDARGEAVAESKLRTQGPQLDASADRTPGLDASPSLPGRMEPGHSFLTQTRDVASSGTTYRLTLYHGNPHTMPEWKKGQEDLTPTMLSLLDHRQDFQDALVDCPDAYRLFGLSHFLEISIVGSRNRAANQLLSLVTLALRNCNCTLPVFVSVPYEDAVKGLCVPGLRGSVSLRFETGWVQRRDIKLETLIRILRGKARAAAKMAHPEATGPTHGDGKLGVTVRQQWFWKCSGRRYSWMGADEFPSYEKRSSGLVDDYALRAASNAVGDPSLRHCWGPIEDPVALLEVFALWKHFPEGAFVENSAYSSLLPEQAPEWWIRANISDAEAPLGAPVKSLGAMLREDSAMQAAFASLALDATARNHDTDLDEFLEDVDRKLGQIFASRDMETVHWSATEMARADGLTGSHEDYPTIPTAFQSAPCFGSLLSVASMRMADCGYEQKYGIRGVATLWAGFLRRLRYHWDTRTVIPRMAVLTSSPHRVAIDETCEINQLLHALQQRIRSSTTVGEEDAHRIPSMLLSASKGDSDAASLISPSVDRLGEIGSTDIDLDVASLSPDSGASSDGDSCADLDDFEDCIAIDAVESTNASASAAAAAANPSKTVVGPRENFSHLSAEEILGRLDSMPTQRVLWQMVSCALFSCHSILEFADSTAAEAARHGYLSTLTELLRDLAQSIEATHFHLQLHFDGDDAQGDNLNDDQLHRCLRELSDVERQLSFATSLMTKLDSNTTLVDSLIRAANPHTNTDMDTTLIRSDGSVLVQGEDTRDAIRRLISGAPHDQKPPLPPPHRKEYILRLVSRLDPKPSTSGSASAQAQTDVHPALHRSRVHRLYAFVNSEEAGRGGRYRFRLGWGRRGLRESCVLLACATSESE